MIEIISGCGLFVFLLAGLGLAWTARAPLHPANRLLLGIGVGCSFIYLVAWTIYWLNLPVGAFWVLPAIALGSLAIRRRQMAEYFRDETARTLILHWAIVAAWCLGWLATVRSYSGGDWVGDWLEHYHRSLFFIEHWPLQTRFIQVYSLPARPPLANLIAGAMMALTGHGFAQFQVFFALLASLVLFPVALLAQTFSAARWPRTIPIAALLLMLNPAFVQNATFTWTKLLMVFFTLSSLHFFLQYRKSAGQAFSGWCAAGFMTAALLTHYSAAPYALVLGGAGVLLLRSDRTRTAEWKPLAACALSCAFLFSTWLVWSLTKFGSATFSANTTVTGSAGLSVGEQLLQRSINVFNTLVPHPVRATDPPGPFLESWDRWHDYFFHLYQTNFLFAFGTGSLGLLVLLVARNRMAAGKFWPWFVTLTFALTLAATSWDDRWGVTHIGLLPLIFLGLAYVAASVPQLSRAWRTFLGCALCVDAVLGICLHFWLQHRLFPASIFANRWGMELVDRHGYATWNNAVGKWTLHLTFLADQNGAWIAAGLCLCASLALGVWLVLKETNQRRATGHETT